MPLILSIDTALDVCSVAIGNERTMLAVEELAGNHLHATHLGVFMQRVFKTAGIKTAELDAISVNMGPGSYTGLRIGVSAAKGLAFSHDLPLIGISCTQILAKAAFEKIQEMQTLYCPLIDARRMEVYYAVYDYQMKALKSPAAAILTTDLFEDILSQQRVVFFGNGMPKARTMLSEHENAFFVDDIIPSGISQLSLAFHCFSSNNFVDLYSFEPDYIKSFMAKDPNTRINKVLNG